MQRTYRMRQHISTVDIYQWFVKQINLWSVARNHDLGQFMAIANSSLLLHMNCLSAWIDFIMICLSALIYTAPTIIGLQRGIYRQSICLSHDKLDILLRNSIYKSKDLFDIFCWSKMCMNCAAVVGSSLSDYLFWIKQKSDCFFVLGYCEYNCGGAKPILPTCREGDRSSIKLLS